MNVIPQTSPLFVVSVAREIGSVIGWEAFGEGEYVPVVVGLALLSHGYQLRPDRAAVIPPSEIAGFYTELGLARVIVEDMLNKAEAKFNANQGVS